MRYLLGFLTMAFLDSQMLYFLKHSGMTFLPHTTHVENVTDLESVGFDTERTDDFERV